MTRAFDRITRWLFLAIFLVFPFQKKNKIFRSFAKSIVPEDAQFPEFFSTSIYYYFTDILILCFAGFCLYRYRHQLFEFFFHGPAKFLMLLTGIGVLSIAFSATATYPLHYIRLFQWFIGVLFFCSSAAYLRTQNRDKVLLQVFWIVCATGLFQAGISIAQYFSQDSIGLKWLGEGSIKTFMFPMQTGQRWLFDSIFGYSTGNPFLLRACGTLGHPNILGGFLFFNLMVSYFLFLKETSRWKACLLQAFIVILVFALSISFSRAAIIATLGASLLWGGFACYQHFSVSKNQEIGKLVKLGSTLMLSLLACLVLFYSQFFYRGGIVSTNEVVKGADSERVVYHKVSMEMVKEAPLLGVGFNQFQLHAKKFTPIDYPLTLYSKVHNIFLLVCSETGICGLIAFCSFIWVLLRALFKSTMNLLSIFSTCLFIGLMFIGICDFYLLEGVQGRILFFSACLFASNYNLFQESKDKILAFIGKKG